MGIFDCARFPDLLFWTSAAIGMAALLFTVVYIVVHRYHTLGHESAFWLFRFMIFFEFLIGILVIGNEFNDFIIRKNDAENIPCAILGGVFCYSIICYMGINMGLARNLTTLSKRKGISTKKSKKQNRNVLLWANLLAVVTVILAAAFSYNYGYSQFGSDCFGLCSFRRGSILSYVIVGFVGITYLFLFVCFLINLFQFLSKKNYTHNLKEPLSMQVSNRNSGQIQDTVSQTNQASFKSNLTQDLWRDRNIQTTLSSNVYKEANSVLQDFAIIEEEKDENEEKENMAITRVLKHMNCSYSLYILALFLFSVPFFGITLADSILVDEKDHDTCDFWILKISAVDVLLALPIVLSLARINMFGTKKMISNIVRKMRARRAEDSICDIPSMQRIESGALEENQINKQKDSCSIEKKADEKDEIGKNFNRFSNLDVEERAILENKLLESNKAMNRNSGIRTMTRGTYFRKDLQNAQTYYKETKDLEKIANMVDKTLTKLINPIKGDTKHKKTEDYSTNVPSMGSFNPQLTPQGPCIGEQVEIPKVREEDMWTLKDYLDYQHFEVEDSSWNDSIVKKNASFLGTGYTDVPDMVLETTEEFSRSKIFNFSVVGGEKTRLVTVFATEPFADLMRIYGESNKLKKDPKRPVLNGDIDHRGYPYLGDKASNCFAPLNTNYNMKIINTSVKKYMIERFLYNYHKYMRAKGSHTYLERLCGLFSLQSNSAQFTSVLLALNPRTDSSSIMFVVSFNNVMKCTHDGNGLNLTPVKSETETNDYRLSGASRKTFEKTMMSDLDFLAHSYLSFYSVVMIIKKRSKIAFEKGEGEVLKTVSRSYAIQPLIINYFSFRVLSVFNPDNLLQNVENNQSMTVSDPQLYKNNVNQQLINYFY